jgi:hypothetical protein
MPKFRLNITVAQKGQIFDAAKSKAAATRMVTAINEVLAEETLARIKAIYNRSVVNPTGYYESQLQVERRGTYRGVTDNKVSYGGWLEGIDPRNRSTRFKGYGSFKHAKSSIQQDKERIAQPAVTKFVNDMNQ